MTQPENHEHGVYVADVNAIMTFNDEQGREWIAAAIVGELVRYEDGAIVETICAEATKDRAFMLSGLKLVAK